MAITPLHETKLADLRVGIYRTNEELGAAAAEEAAQVVRRAVEERGGATIILATGNSQLTFLAALRHDRSIPWPQVTIFHMDEYVGLPPEHPASFPRFLRRHLLDHITPRAFYPVPGQSPDPEQACQDYEALLRAHPADLCALGFGENGHLAFNDPPFADFDDPAWVKVVKLAEASRRQQVGEGHFGGLDEVPTHAITLTIPALLSARQVLAIVPEARKAEAVQQALYGPLSEECPASILRQVPHAHLFLDADSAARIYPHPPSPSGRRQSRP
jgi:glucosamine-6-phosphate deaminase